MVIKSISRFLLVGALTLILGGCASQPEPSVPEPRAAEPPAALPSPVAPRQSAPRVLDLEPLDTPAGYVPLSAIGDALVLGLDDGSESRSLHLYVGGQVKAHIATTPYNHMFSWASDDDQWLVWAENERDAGRSQVDEWTIWAWNRESNETHMVAKAGATANELGLPSNWDIGPEVRVAAGRLLWASFDPTEQGTRLQLHLYELATREEQVLESATVDQLGLLAYDISGDRVAYRRGQEIVLRSFTGEEERISVGDHGAVRLTDFGVVWAEGRRKLLLYNGVERKELPTAESDRWEFTSSQRYVTWFELLSNSVWVLDTQTGEVLQAAENAVQGGRISNAYVMWWTPATETEPARRLVARLP